MTSHIHSVEDIQINKTDKKRFSITYDPFFITFFSLFNIAHSSQDNRLISFKCKSVMSLENYVLEHKNLSTDFILKLIYDLGYIIKTLEQQEKCIIGFSLRDIVILNGDTFMFVNAQKIVNVNSAGEGVLKSPINLTGSFLHPDVDTNTLPIKFPKGLSNYSFGLFITFLLTNKKHSNYNIEAKKDSSLLSSLNEIYGSKLYYFVLRCLDEKQFLYI